MTRFCLPLVALAALSGCGKAPEAKPAETTKPAPAPAEAAPEPTAVSADLVAFETGAQWVYDQESVVQAAEGGQEIKGEFTIKAEDVSESDEGQVIKLKTTNPPPAKDSSMVWRLGVDGLVQVSGLDAKERSRDFDPPMPLLPPTIKAGEKFGWKGRGVRLDGTVGQIDVVVTVIGLEEPDTLMGSMKAWLVESVAVWGGTGKDQIRARTQSWWSPKVGLVRMIRELDAPDYGLKTVLRLKSHTVKQ